MLISAGGCNGISAAAYYEQRVMPLPAIIVGKISQETYQLEEDKYKAEKESGAWFVETNELK
uniref:Uncharacterized protein n=1 Tax=viral metagenome TaxID=1070528 RepID=A0A6M3JAY8_9ZZZZ